MASPSNNYEVVSTLFAAAARIERQLDRSLSSIKGISFSEYQLLRALQGEHDASATRVDLAAAVGLSPSGVTRALKPLEKMGHVETRKDERDARRSLAALTSHGTELVDDANAVVRDVLAADNALASLSAADRKKLLVLLTVLA